MTKETQEKIYDKFFQAAPSHSQDGAGLGLSIVKRIIAVHQGKIHIDRKKQNSRKIYLTCAFIPV